MVNSILNNLYSMEHLELVLNWHRLSYVHPIDDESCMLYSICGGTLHKLVKQAFKHPALEEERKLKMMNDYLGANNSDLAINMRYTCMASLPDPENKERVWQELIDPMSTLSIYQR